MKITKKIGLVFGVTSVAGALYLGKSFYLGDKINPSTPQAIDIVATTPKAEGPIRKPIKTISNGLSTGVDMFVANSPSKSSNLSSAKEANDTVVWTHSEKAETILKSQNQIPADVSNEVYVELDLKELNSVEIGDYLDLYIPQIDGSYTAEVDFIQNHDNGDRTIEANIPGAGRLYSAVITVGKDAVYGNLATQNDVYIMEGSGKYAWIAAKSDLVSNHATSHVDGVIPKGEVTPVKGNTFTVNSN